MERIRLGVSQCLLGDRVRYDGQHKRDAFIVDTLGPFVEFVPVCPEVECGLPVPREAMRLVGDPAAPRLVTLRTKRDLTEQMLSWVRRRVVELEREDLCGYIFKAKSPSSGMERVKVYNEKGGLSGHGSGLFARAFMEHFPTLPVEEEGRLNDPVLRENFVTRIFTLKRYRDAVAAGSGIRALTDFHAEHKYLLMSHSDAACRAMGTLLARAGADAKAERRGAAGGRPGGSLRPVTSAAPPAGGAPVVEAYEGQLLAALKLIATVAKHRNVLQHIVGYFKRLISADEKQELLRVIDQYAAGLVPLIVPVTLLNHYVRKYDVAYLAHQAYLNPHPAELKLRNHA